MLSPALTRFAALLLLCAADPRSACAGLADPTRPLAGGPAAAAPGHAGPALAAPAAAAASAVAPAPPQLQSLQLPREGDPSALVDGQLLRVGQRLNGYEVLSIDARGVGVRGPQGRQRWTLLGVETLDGAAAAEPGAGSRRANRARPAPVKDLARPAPPAAPLPPNAPTTQAPPAPVRLSWADLIGPAPAPVAVAAARPAARPPVLAVSHLTTGPSAGRPAPSPSRGLPAAPLSLRLTLDSQRSPATGQAAAVLACHWQHRQPWQNLAPRPARQAGPAAAAHCHRSRRAPRRHPVVAALPAAPSALSAIEPVPLVALGKESP